MLAREGLLGERRWKYRAWSLGVDEEATESTVALRDYLYVLWNLTSVGRGVRTRRHQQVVFVSLEEVVYRVV